MGIDMQSIRTTLRPEGSRWPQLVQAAPPMSTRARQFRQELGLPVDRPIVMSGHQADLWHPGILAKYFALQAIARKNNAHAVWLVVDQDVHQPSLQVPVRLADGGLSRRDGLSNLLTGRSTPDTPVSQRASSTTVSVARLETGELYASPHVAVALQRSVVALKARSSEPSLARQVAFAANDLLSDFGPAPQLLFATELSSTAFFQDLVRDMHAQPEALARTYNQAVARHPKARIAPLEVSANGEVETPLWQIDAGAGFARRKITASNIASASPSSLVPRALLMTGMLRWLGCELFIHGTGGAGSDGDSGYDAITQEWLSEWLGATLSPMALATATMLLDIPSPRGLITPEEIAHARWKLHAAAHRPSMLNDHEGEAAREEAVATLVELRRKRDPDSRQIKLRTYRQLHKTLEAARDRHPSELQAFKESAEAAAARKDEADILGDRTWSFVLHSQDRLRELQSIIQRQIG